MTTIDLDSVTLTTGSHKNRDNGVCLMEATAWYAGEPHSDHPQCVSPVLVTFGMRLNDRLPEERRQNLKWFIPQMIEPASDYLDENSDDLDEVRLYMALDWLIRTWIPQWLELANLAESAAALRDLQPIADLATAHNAVPVMRDARIEADAKAAEWETKITTERIAKPTLEAVTNAVRDAVRDAVRKAFRLTLRDAVWEIRVETEECGPWDVWDDAWDTSKAVSWAATWVTAGVAAWDAAWDAAGDPTDFAVVVAVKIAVKAVVKDKLKPTVDMLQTSAIALFEKMIRAGWTYHEQDES